MIQADYIQSASLREIVLIRFREIASGADLARRSQTSWGNVSCTPSFGDSRHQQTRGFDIYARDTKIMGNIVYLGSSHGTATMQV
jgi:hypothetical protein